jgi:putative DNA methylase
MTVRTALSLINQTLTEVLSELEDEFDAETRWAIPWFDQHGFDEGDFGDAELLSKAKVTSVSGLQQMHIIQSRAGKVHLLRPEELPPHWKPAAGKRLAVWEMTHHLLRVYFHDKSGDVVSAELLRSFGAGGEMVRELAYQLFHVCEKRKRPQEALAYNALVLGWPEIARLAREAGKTPEHQAALFEQER